jgi:ferredoxin
MVGVSRISGTGADVRVEVDLTRCRDMAQCVYAAPQVFTLTDGGRQAFRLIASDIYVSADLDESWRDALEEAADVCPMRAILLRG